MKLIVEEINDYQSVILEEAGKKAYYIEGIFLQSNIQNRNGRYYPKSVMAEEVNRYNKEFVQTNRAVGELGHPNGPQINFERVSHIIKDLREDGDNFIGRAKIMTGTPYGKIVANFIDEGYKFGVSSRGMGSIKKNSSGIMEVQNDFRLATAADIVHDPSAPQAFVNGIMEGTEFWMTGDGTWQAKPIEQLRESMQKMSAKDITARQLALFEAFLGRITTG